jgi:5-hydroxyisourate hydrolase-like protein (transthyretin family)
LRAFRFLAVLAFVVFPVIHLQADRTAAQDTQPGVIFGRIINGTTGEPVPEIAVSLSTFAGGTLQAGQDTLTDADGRFEFPSVDTDPEAVYAVSATFFGIAYSTGRISFEEGSEGIDVTLDVYEPTEDQSLVTIPSRGIILTDVEPVRGELGLLDIVVLEMSENRALVANDEGRTLSFPVPRNASRVTPLPGSGYDLQTATIEGATVFGTEPLLPGEATATLSYTLPYTGDRLSVELQSAYDTAVFRILLPKEVTNVDRAIEVEAPGFTYSGEEEIGPQVYDVWIREGVQTGDRIRITYAQLTHSEIQPNTLNKFGPVIVSGMAIAGAIGLVLWLVRGRRLYAERPLVLAPELATSLETRRSDLIEQLQALETAHASDRIEEPDYTEYRRTVLEQIRLVNRQMRGEGVED